MVPHFGFNLNFLLMNIAEYLFFCDYWPFYIICYEVTSRSFVLSLFNTYIEMYIYMYIEKLYVCIYIDELFFFLLFFCIEQISPTIDMMLCLVY